jgi:Ring finger domain/SWIM zinc finger
VKIDYGPTCTCPDFLRKQDLCKHIFFVLIKCIGVDVQSYLLYQKAFLSNEIRALFIKMEERRTGGTVAVVEASETVRAAYKKCITSGGDDGDDDDDNDGVARKSLEADADCPICFDSLVEEDSGSNGLGRSSGAGNLVYCRSACGSNFHADCIRRWLAQSSHSDCPNCRQPWIDPNPSTSNPKKRQRQGEEGYLNLSDVTGQSPQRDTSTYHSRTTSSYHYSKSRRRYRC